MSLAVSYGFMFLRSLAQTNSGAVCELSIVSEHVEYSFIVRVNIGHQVTSIATKSVFNNFRSRESIVRALVPRVISYKTRSFDKKEVNGGLIGPRMKLEFVLPRFQRQYCS